MTSTAIFCFSFGLLCFTVHAASSIPYSSQLTLPLQSPCRESNPSAPPSSTAPEASPSPSEKKPRIEVEVPKKLPKPKPELEVTGPKKKKARKSVKKVEAKRLAEEGKCRVEKGVAYLDGDVLDEKKTRSHIACCELCRRNDKCFSWYRNGKTKECVLNKDIPSAVKKGRPFAGGATL